MAKTYILAKSYYEWREKQGHRLPVHMSTDPSSLAESARSLYEETGEERAKYWYDIFASKARENLSEGIMVDKLIQWLRPRSTEEAPNESIIIQKIREVLIKAREAMEEIGAYRKGMWSYEIIDRWYREDELQALSRSLGYSVSSDEVTAADYERGAYKRRVWLMALNPFNIPNFFRDLLEIGKAPIEVTVALLIWFMKKAFGEKVARDVTNRVFD